MKAGYFTHGAKFEYNIDWVSGRNVIFIVDIGHQTHKSVTNDIENVVASIGKWEKVDPKRYMIVYKDSDGVWDGWDATTGQFVPLRADSSIDAVYIYVRKQLASVDGLDQNTFKPEE